ncbi:hypothetical protein M2421_001601 [Stenotrophomonas sp. BIGb0135]|nr:hypothetical protein [Stenotrophomonas sp. BIGb0135]
MNQWESMGSAPNDGVILLRVRAKELEREEKVFVAAPSFRDGVKVWLITVGWAGWTTLHSGWQPVGWQPLPLPVGEVVT